MTQAQWPGARPPEAEQGPPDPAAGAAARRRERERDKRDRDRVILTQPPPPPPKPRRPTRDDDEPDATQPTGEAESGDRSDEVLAEIDELVEGR
ncbi:hypothetical protein [Paractinoplanes globisporus]|jgi:hypothetical protein|uniref:Uncharacterized protein n=1 Tax=Paractinoplanes globisporus TaxID=113565 RepID=A0ABW6WSL1_9ACTN|nr:hypothetical protein [Actinoplanes globisporus]